MPLPCLTADEIDDICKPLTQHAAQVRFIRETLRLPVERRVDGSPLVKRVDWERARDARGAEAATTRGPNWTVPA